MPIYGYLLIGGKTVNIVHKATKVGSNASDNNLVINRYGIEEEHAVIFCMFNNLILVDLNTIFGTYVNERRIKAKILKDEDVIKIGRATFVFKENKNKIIIDEVDENDEESEIESYDIDTIIPQNICNPNKLKNIHQIIEKGKKKLLDIEKILGPKSIDLSTFNKENFNHQAFYDLIRRNKNVYIKEDNNNYFNYVNLCTEKKIMLIKNVICLQCSGFNKKNRPLLKIFGNLLLFKKHNKSVHIKKKESCGFVINFKCEGWKKIIINRKKIYLINEEDLCDYNEDEDEKDI